MQGPLRYFGDPEEDGSGRLIQLAWACLPTPGGGQRPAQSRYVAIPGVQGDSLGDVLLEFIDLLLNVPNPRLVTYNMELNAGILAAEMNRCRLPYTRKRFEEIVRTRGYDLMDPDMGSWLLGTEAFPMLDELAEALQIYDDGLPEFRTGEQEAALYLDLVGAAQLAGMTDCERNGHQPIRVSRGCMRDNGDYDNECRVCGAVL